MRQRPHQVVQFRVDVDLGVTRLAGRAGHENPETDPHLRPRQSHAVALFHEFNHALSQGGGFLAEFPDGRAHLPQPRVGVHDNSIGELIAGHFALRMLSYRNC
jgi:hypothetical protein